MVIRSMFTDENNNELKLRCTTICTIPILTKTRTVHTLRLFHEAVDFVHLFHRSLRPALLLDDQLHFVTKSPDVLRIGRQVVKCLSETLKKFVVRPCSIQIPMSNVHLRMSRTQTNWVSIESQKPIGTYMNSSKVDDQNTRGYFAYVALRAL